jgi:hypothetical protein
MKKQLKSILPDWFVEYVKLRKRSNSIKNKPIKETFTHIKEQDAWNSSESVSGEGSELKATKELSRLLPGLLEKHEITAFLDIPCGDFNWMQYVDLEKVRYIGGDIVESLIDSNRKQYSNDNREFLVTDLTNDKLPKVDVVFSRDCLVHLSYKDIYKALKRIKESESTYVLLTSFYNCKKNRNIITGQWRKINFELFPFYFKKPIDIIDEKYTLKGEHYSDKVMALWKVSELKISLRLKLYYWFT